MTTHPDSGKQESRRPLQKMFASVPPSYDIVNRALTLRLDQAWRSKAAAMCMENRPSRVLDLCCGTGDLAMHLRKRAGTAAKVYALDFSEPMLQLASGKAISRRYDDVEFIHGDAAEMPFDDGYFDSIGIAFAFRNLTFNNPDTSRFLSEILRVLKPGGLFVAVETSQPKNRLLRKLFHIYLKYVTAPFGGLVSGHRGAYKYLSHSAINYYMAPELTELLMTAGFKNVSFIPLLGGIAGILKSEKQIS